MFDGKPLDGHGCRILGLGSQALAISHIRCHVVLSLWLRGLSITPRFQLHVHQEHHERPEVYRHGVVGEETPDHLLKPLPLFGVWDNVIAGAAPP